KLAAVVVGEIRDRGKRVQLRVHGADGSVLGDEEWSAAGGPRKLAPLVGRGFWAKLGGALEGARDAGRAGKRARPEPEPHPAGETREASAEPEQRDRDKEKEAPEAAAAPAADEERAAPPEPRKVAAASDDADERPPPRRRVERQRTETVATEAES